MKWMDISLYKDKYFRIWNAKNTAQKTKASSEK